MDGPELELIEESRIYREGIQLFNEGQYFEAHDAWEEVWKLTADKRRERFYRGITQGAVTLELLRRGRAIGVRQVFAGCHELLVGLPPIFMGLDIPRFLDRLRHAIQAAIDDLETATVAIDPTRLFQFELLYDPLAEPRGGEVDRGG